MAKEKIVNLTDRVPVVATAKHPFASKGDKFNMHPEVAELFVRKGYVEKEKK